MYTIENYKAEMLKFIEENGYKPIKISKQTFDVFFRHESNMERRLYENLFTIFAMEEGPEFEMTETEFRDFVNSI